MGGLCHKWPLKEGHLPQASLEELITSPLSRAAEATDNYLTSDQSISREVHSYLIEHQNQALNPYA